MTERNELLGISKGIICQQCNCQGAYGAGLSGLIAKKYPVVLDYFKAHCKQYSTPESRFGQVQLIPIGRDLYVANIYTQLNYGNSAKTGIKYTDTAKLVAAVKEIAEKNQLPVYLPHTVDKYGRHSGIGCGLAGEKWENLSPLLLRLKLDNLYTINTFTGETKPLKDDVPKKRYSFERE